jgi:hypothetical protein
MIAIAYRYKPPLFIAMSYLTYGCSVGIVRSRTQTMELYDNTI